LEPSPFDVSYICFTFVGVAFLISYIVFTYFVLHRGDFYHIRRWKAAIWAAVISVVLFSAFLFAFLFFQGIKSPLANSSKDVAEIIILLIGTFLPALVIFVPLLFLITLGTHHQLKWMLNSDDLLDKIWPDPNKGNKSPIQGL
jgi:membrane protease YdiL (CAAX protease family)